MKENKVALIVGLALFATHFGAGNLIFPATLGYTAGDKWPIAVAGFSITAIVLAMLTFVVICRFDGIGEELCRDVGPRFALIFVSVQFIAGGLLVGVPRTASLCYELGVGYFLPDAPKLPVIVAFFALVVFLNWNKTNVMAKVGKYLTPFLVLMMLFIIGKGILDPVGTAVEKESAGLFRESFIYGYQTLDALAGISFAASILASITAYGYPLGEKTTYRVSRKCALVAGICLFVIYGGLGWVGSTVSGIYPAGLDQTTLLRRIVEDVAGQFGLGLLSAAITLACITCGVGCVSGIAIFFERILGKWLTYRQVLTGVVTLQGTLAMLTVKQITNLAMPLLLAIIPMGIYFVFLSLIRRWIGKKYRHHVYTWGAVGVGFVTISQGVMEVLPVPALSDLYRSLPLASVGMEWVTVGAAASLLGAATVYLKEKKQ